MFYGGEAGGGKTAALVLEGLRNYDVPRFGAIIFRRESPQLDGPQSLWELISEWYPALGAKLARHKFRARFPSGATLQLQHLQLEKDKYKHQGKGYGFIGFDELTHFTESQFWYLYSRSRSTSGVAPYVRATMNPDPDSWVKKMIEWYLDDNGEFVRPERSGVIRYFYRVDDALDWDTDRDALMQRHPEMVDPDGVQVPPTSFTFILARLTDNKILLSKDPGYRAKLMALPKVDRERLLGKGQGGNWKIRPAAGLYFKRTYFRELEAVPLDLVDVVRGWDKAATEPSLENKDPDYTVGLKMGVTSLGRFVVLDCEYLRGSPHKVAVAMKRVAEHDGKRVRIGIWQDPAQAGVVDKDDMFANLLGFHVESEVARENKLVYAGPWSAQAENGRFDIVKGPWNEFFYSQVERFPEGKHKDVVDAGSRAFMMLHNSAVVAYQAAMKAISAEMGG